MSNFYASKWQEAIEIVKTMDIYEDSKKDIIFFLIKMKYIEALENQDFGSALQILREEMTSVYSDNMYQEEIDK